MGLSTSCKLTGISSIGLFLVLLGSIFAGFWPRIFDHILNGELVLTKTSTSFHLWEVSQIPLFFEFYLFTWVNPEEFTRKGVKPRLQERGPYVFREYRRKIIKDWFPENGTVTYFQNRTWIFDPELSIGSLDDEITTINVPAITASYSIRHKGKGLKFILNGLFDLLGTKIWVRKKVREFLFEGYDDPLLEIGKKLPVSTPFDKFGWFYTRNGSATYDGIFNMQTGQNGIQNLGLLSNWDFVNSTFFYEGHCGDVNGSAGEFFPPRLLPKQISVFSPDACRTLTLSFQREVMVEGIPALRFIGDESMFLNKSSNPDNWCFCPDESECAPNGVMDVSTCKWGAPAFISFPHFYRADPHFRESVEGMTPKEPIHQMIIDVEPISGIPLQVSAGLQINILVQPMPEYSLLKNVPKIYFPAVWFRQVAVVDDRMIPQLRMLTSLPYMGSIASYTILGIGIGVLVAAAILYFVLIRRKSPEGGSLSPIFGLNGRLAAAAGLKNSFFSLRGLIKRRNQPEVPQRVVSMSPGGHNLSIDSSSTPSRVSSSGGRHGHPRRPSSLNSASIRPSISAPIPQMSEQERRRRLALNPATASAEMQVSPFYHLI